MKGVIFNLLEQVVVDAYGNDVWDDLLDDANVGGAYTSLGNYPDAEIEALVAAVSRKTGTTREEALRWFGKQALPLMRTAYPNLFLDHASSRDFVLSVNEKIHPEVRKLYPEASCPFFHIVAASPDEIRMNYKSDRDMAELAHGFILGAANLFGDIVSVSLASSEMGGKIDHLQMHYGNG